MTPGERHVWVVISAAATLCACSLDTGALPPPARDASLDTGTDTGLPDSTPPDSDTGTVTDSAPPDTTIIVDGGECVEGMRVCAMGVARECVGGMWVDETCAYACSSDFIRCADFTPSNVGPGYPDDTCPDVAITSDVTYDTGSCSAIDIGRVDEVTQSDGSQLCVICAGDITVSSGVTITFEGPLPVAFVASGTVTIDGDVDVSGNGRLRGAGGWNGGAASRPGGFGPLPGTEGQDVGGSDGGGGGGGACGRGGVGGDGGSASGGAGGATVDPTWFLSPLFGGSGGGLGRGDGANSGVGGGGGGAVQFSAAGTLTLRGRILAGGGGGGRGNDRAVEGDAGAGGGGGGGGSVLLEAPIVTLEGGSVLASGGGGGGSNGGENGQDGRGVADRADGGAGGTSIRAAAGGRSGGASGNSGRSGENNTNSSGNGGGGGGGVGCVVYRTLSGDLPAGASGGNPALDPALRAAAFPLI